MRRRYVTRGDEMCKRCRALCNGYPQVWYKPRARIRACKPEKVPTFSHPLPVSFFQTTEGGGKAVARTRSRWGRPRGGTDERAEAHEHELRG